MTTLPFWKRKSLYEMTDAEWESLCDGCGRCCLHKLENEDTGDIAVTDVACTLLDLNTCRCSDYENRQKTVPDCIRLTARTVGLYDWLPKTCAYRILDKGGDLPDWHPLVSGNPDSVHDAGISIRDEAVSENEVDDLEEHVVDWIARTGNPFLKEE